MSFLDEKHILLFLVQVFILLFLCRSLGELFRRWKQPALTIELLIGVVLGPTVLGRFLPELHSRLFPPHIIQQNMLETVAWVGVLLLLLETGLEIDFSVAWRQRGNALTIAISDIFFPMLVAFIPCLFLPEKYLMETDRRIIFALFMATAMTISAMPVAARALHELNILKAEIGFLIMSALAVNDIIGWVLFTIVMGFFARSAFTVGGVIIVFAVTIGFAILALTFGRYLSSGALSFFERKKLPEPGTSLTFAVLMGLLFGAVTQHIGIHALFGFFIAGVVVGEAKNLSQESRQIISQMVYSVFVPLFFANVGLKMDFAANFDFALVAFVCLIGIAGRYFGAWFGVTLTGTPRVNRDVISIAHTPGGMMEIVVALIALEGGLISQKVFVAVVFSAVFSSVIVGPWMRRAINKRASVSVMDFLSKDSVIPVLTSSNRHDAIRELAGKIAARSKSVDADKITAILMKREREFSTGIGNSVAIPHLRMKEIINPVLAFGRSMSGVEWDAPDGKPARYIFMLAMPEGINDVHVQILSSISKAMKNPENHLMIDSSQDSQDLWNVLKSIFTSGAGAK